MSVFSRKYFHDEAAAFEHKANRQNIIPVVQANIDKETKVMTDEAYHYNKLGNDFESHESVNHNQGEYVRGKVHTNTFRYNNRLSCGINNQERFENIFKEVSGKRLTYRRIN